MKFKVGDKVRILIDKGHFTSADNPYLPFDELEQVKKEYANDMVSYQQEVLAEYETAKKANNRFYMRFLENAKPLWIPNRKLGWIVTSRLEKYRTVTEKWLKDHSVEYGHLFMMRKGML